MTIYAQYEIFNVVNIYDDLLGQLSHDKVRHSSGQTC